MNELRQQERMGVIRREEYVPFAGQKHVFLTGDLKRPNPNPFIREPRLEWVFCFYEAGDDGVPHWHRQVTEYETVLEGEIGYLEAASGETTWLQPGDFTTVPAGVCVKRIVRTRSRTIATKVPSLDERVVCSECARECRARIAPYIGHPEGRCD
jgi:mannose-6-phosphate isomerase-like protein (cupin superfamily)